LFTIRPYGDGRETEAITLIASGIKTRDAIGIPPDLPELHPIDCYEPVGMRSGLPGDVLNKKGRWNEGY
jgi:hypothetical protein